MSILRCEKTLFDVIANNFGKPFGDPHVVLEVAICETFEVENHQKQGTFAFAWCVGISGRLHFVLSGD